MTTSMNTTNGHFGEKGFTLVELLIVIVTIGILAAIVVVSYNGSQKRGYDASVQSDLDSASGLLESFRQDPNNADIYPQAKAMLDPLGIKATKSAYNTSNALNFVYCINNSSDPTLQYKSYALVAESKSGNIFMMTQDGLKPATTTHANLIAGNTCSGLGMGLVSSGMFAANTWQSWVGGS